MEERSKIFNDVKVEEVGLFYKLALVLLSPILSLSYIAVAHNSELSKWGKVNIFFDFGEDGIEIITYATILATVSLLIASISKRILRNSIFGTLAFLTILVGFAFLSSGTGGSGLGNLGILFFVVFILPACISFWVCFLGARYLFKHQKILKLLLLILFVNILINVFISLPYLMAVVG